MQLSVKRIIALLLINTIFLEKCLTFSFPFTLHSYPKSSSDPSSRLRNLVICSNKKEWTSDFDDFSFENDDNDTFEFSKLFQERVAPEDLTACQTRQFLLGSDLVLSDYVGSMGFDEVTDWEYYYPSEDDDRDGSADRKVVQPNPFDSSKPTRTRESSGSVVRLFRGEFVGLTGGVLSSTGLDKRVLIKEFSGELALELAKAELESVGKLQSDLLMNFGDADKIKQGNWIKVASARSVMVRQDNFNLAALLDVLLKKAPFLGILGEINLEELEEDMEPNEFYRAMGVLPPKPGAIWIVYEYAGLSTAQAYAVPGAKRRASMPLQKRGFFGTLQEPPALPPWRQRANYVVKGVIKGTLEALANMHESGIVHRSIGKSSIVMSSKTMDKREAATPYATITNNLVVKLADFGFSGLYRESAESEEFIARARSFGLVLQKSENSIASTNFAIAEDMHAAGFAFLGILLTSLAEPDPPSFNMPDCGEDTLQRLLGEIFDKDVRVQFREYVEADPVWTNLVKLLDEKNGAGWTVLETLLMAREKAAATAKTGSTQIFTVRGLLSNPFFQ